MHYFLDTDFDPKKGVLNEVESRHALKSMRLRSGDKLRIGDGHGNLYTAVVTDTSGKTLEVDVLEIHNDPPSECRLTIGVAPPKNPTRFDWFLEKATELGVDTIVPMRTERTEQPHIKYNRAARVITAASKQSQRPYLPVLDEILDFEKVVAMAKGEKYIAHCNGAFLRLPVSEVAAQCHSSAWVLIGPEGDFSPEEIRRAENMGFRGIDLGSRRLRTETAAIFATGLFKLSQWENPQ